jgi:hypothetical protein
VRAGFTEPPLIGPMTMISHATASPMIRPPNPAGARLSTASAMIVASSRNVPRASAVSAWPFVKPTPTIVPPDALRSTACEPKIVSTRIPPIAAPASWARTYGTTSTQGKRRTTASATVTAGLM